MLSTRIAFVALLSLAEAVGAAGERSAASRVEGYRQRISETDLEADDRVQRLAAFLNGTLGIAPPNWWRTQAAATLDNQLSRASPRIKTNARIEERAEIPSRKHVIVVDDGRGYEIHPLTGDLELDYANVYKHRNHVYVLAVGSVMNPFPVIKLSTESGEVVWRAEITEMPTVGLGGYPMRHLTAVSLRDGKLVISSVRLRLLEDLWVCYR